MKKLLWFALSLLTATVARASLSPEEIYEKTAPAVLNLEVENAQQEKFVGSAFLAFRPGVAVTAWHVVHDAQKITARFPGNQPVKVLGLIAKDEARDIAVLEIESTNPPALKLADVKPRIGARIYVIGAPQGLDFSIADGLIGQVRDMEGLWEYQLSCPISPGNSGGPVVNAEGEIVGLVSWRKPDAQNVSFAVPSFEIGRMDSALEQKTLPVGTFAKKKPEKPVLAAPVAARQSTNPAGLTDFQQALSANAGKQVTVTLDDGKGARKFTFAAPTATEK